MLLMPMSNNITTRGQSAFGLWLAVLQLRYESLSKWHARFNSVPTEDSVSCVLYLGVLSESLMSAVIRHALLDQIDGIRATGTKSNEELRQLEHEGTSKIVDSTWSKLTGEHFKRYFGKGLEGCCDSSTYASIASLMRQRNFLAHGLPMEIKIIETKDSDGAIVSTELSQLKDSAFSLLRQKGLIPNANTSEVSFHAIYTKEVVDFFLDTVLELSGELERLSASHNLPMAEMHAQVCRQRLEEIAQQNAT